MFQPTETGDWDNLLPQRIFYSPPVGCRHVRPARQLGVNLPKAAGRNHKKYPRFQVEIGDISFHLFPQVAGPCVSSVRCDTMRYLADGNSTLQNNLLAYSHSFMLVCRGAIPIGSSLVVGLSTLPPNPSACPRVDVWGKPWDKFANYFETASSQFHFCPGDKNGLVLRP